MVDREILMRRLCERHKEVQSCLEELFIHIDIKQYKKQKMYIDILTDLYDKSSSWAWSDMKLPAGIINHPAYIRMKELSKISAFDLLFGNS